MGTTPLDWSLVEVAVPRPSARLPGSAWPDSGTAPAHRWTSPWSRTRRSPCSSTSARTRASPTPGRPAPKRQCRRRPASRRSPGDGPRVRRVPPDPPGAGRRGGRARRADGHLRSGGVPQRRLGLRRRTRGGQATRQRFLG
ncbi:hypothetical protein NKG94_49575 [Micromonospora sp. M12]